MRILLTVLLCLCAPLIGADEKPLTKEESAGNPFPEATPESQGVPSGVVDRLGELVRGFVEAEEIVGAELLVIKNRRTVMHDVFGHDDHRGDKALVKNTIFSIRSMTKPLTWHRC